MQESQWTYRLFLSVDIQNSTAFKKKTFEEGTPKNAEWAWLFEDFYKEFSDSFYNKLKTYSDLEQPKIWKCLGDEIIYQVEIKDSANIQKYVFSFRDTIEYYNENSQEKDKEFQAQGTVWGAGFPVRNYAIKVPDSSTDDFIGIDIDIGFRISKYSKPERLVISLPIAYILSQYNCETIRYYDEINAKGVDSEYPIFWILSSSRPKIPGRSLITPSPIDSIIEFCKTYFEDDKKTIYSEPFICNDISEKFSSIPKNMNDRKIENDKAAKEHYKNSFNKEIDEPNNIADENNPENAKKLEEIGINLTFP